ncbi:hypothetical protein DY000_02060546 [Brassica cretica]|uniref:Uncharacterized protein n=1 Tax=Brassica cretica TaxID=69181 RepID=A0ABQ7AUT0_BRACR|nr:hypothetical protein DY000_02060546 [Brassica cretica]
MERPKQEEVKRLKREAVEAEKNKKKRAQSGVKQYFALDQPKKGLKHLKFSAKNNHVLVDRCPDREEGQEAILWYKHDPYNAPRICMLKGKEDRCNVCYYYKQMQMVLHMIT